jgi:F-type H+-transporting ATPase subunit a
MAIKSMKSLLGVVFSLTLLSLPSNTFAQEKKGFDANEVIFGHIMDAHEFHFFSYKGDGGKLHHATIPLPVILYSKERGFCVFMSSQFHHGEKDYNGYRLLTDEKIAELQTGRKKYTAGEIVAVNDQDNIDTGIKIYDVSLTRNVVQMIIALTLLVVIMLTVAKRYKSGRGITSAPKGLQNLIEPLITFVRDEVAVPNLGRRYHKYFPYLLTVFFFILINNLVGLIPGSANVTGNIAFTMVLSVISFIVILISTKKHYWSHIFWPPVPHGVKVILIPVETLGKCRWCYWGRVGRSWCRYRYWPDR